MTTLLRALLVSLAVGLVSCAPADEHEELDVAFAEDMITAEELREGASWHGHDDFDPDEHVDLAAESADTSGDDPIDEGEDDDAAHPAALRPLSNGCRAVTGYTRGRPTRICLSTVDGKAIEQKTALAYAKMRAAAKRAGVNLVVVSGFRTMQRQRQLYALYKRGRGNLAAPPGFSNHQSGLALDLNAKARGVNAWLSRNASAYGFRRTVPSENWHYERR
jgi:hypothetical protein